jgi:hypothetical protein
MKKRFSEKLKRVIAAGRKTVAGRKTKSTHFFDLYERVATRLFQLRMTKTAFINEHKLVKRLSALLETQQKTLAAVDKEIATFKATYPGKKYSFKEKAKLRAVKKSTLVMREGGKLFDKRQKANLKFTHTRNELKKAREAAGQAFEKGKNQRKKEIERLEGQRRKLLSTKPGIESLRSDLFKRNEPGWIKLMETVPPTKRDAWARMRGDLEARAENIASAGTLAEIDGLTRSIFIMAEKGEIKEAEQWLSQVLRF